LAHGPALRQRHRGKEGDAERAHQHACEHLASEERATHWTRTCALAPPQQQARCRRDANRTYSRRNCRHLLTKLECVSLCRRPQDACRHPQDARAANRI
jgi:hypothetical protein